MSAPPPLTTGPDFQRVVVLADGVAVTIRHVRPEDAAQFRREFETLSPTSRFRRFFGGGPSALSEETLRYLTHVDGQDHVALVAVAESLDLKSERGVGVARFIRSSETPEIAEPAVTVVDDWQGRGLGRLLLEALADAARERGVRSFRAEVLASNEPMHHILGAAGAVLVREGEGTRTYDVPLPPPDAEPPRRDWALARLLREAAASTVALVRNLPLPPPPY